MQSIIYTQATFDEAGVYIA